MFARISTRAMQIHCWFEECFVLGLPPKPHPHVSVLEVFAAQQNKCMKTGSTLAFSHPRGTIALSRKFREEVDL